MLKVSLIIKAVLRVIYFSTSVIVVNVLNKKIMYCALK
jgi:hypothetical protein